MRPYWATINTLTGRHKKGRVFLDGHLFTRCLTSAAFPPVLGPSLSKTLGLREGVVLVLLSDMVFEFSTVTFRLILDILQG